MLMIAEVYYLEDEAQVELLVGAHTGQTYLVRVVASPQDDLHPADLAERLRSHLGGQFFHPPSSKQ